MSLFDDIIYLFLVNAGPLVEYLLNSYAKEKHIYMQLKINNQEA